MPQLDPQRAIVAQKTLGLKIRIAIDEMRRLGLSPAQIFETVEEVYWEAEGERYLSEHHGGDVPPRLVVPSRLVPTLESP